MKFALKHIVSLYPTVFYVVLDTSIHNVCHFIRPSFGSMHYDCPSGNSSTLFKIACVMVHEQ